MHELTDIAEHILTSTSLEEKLRFSPRLDEISDLRPDRPIHLPDQPGRPPELLLREDGVRPDFPNENQLDDARQRGIMMHFLCNHELLATELMALVLLKFPDAPKEFRLGVYDTLREEQAHTLMYLRRMRECGMEFGELPVNSYFWRSIAPMETPMDFVSRLSLTFEQANLDFSKHYAGLFREVGDTSTAAVLEKIYQDEIGHVGHGLHWFRQWKDPKDTDWQAFRKVLSFPLNPVRAKGMAPFNPEGRREAGLDEDYIRHLRVLGHSRGRPSTLHWMNPLAEAEAAAAAFGKSYVPKKTEKALHDDLATLPWVLCKKDDAVLVKEPPSLDFLDGLQNAGFETPEFATLADITDRRLGGLQAWAWTPDAHRRAEPFKQQVPDRPELRQPSAWPNELFSQGLGQRLNVALLGEAEAPRWVRTEAELLSAIEATPRPLLKALWSSAGRGIRRVTPNLPWKKWALNQLRNQGGLLVETHREVVAEFSALYEVAPGEAPRHLGFTHLLTDECGRYLGTRIASKWANSLEPEHAKFLFAEARCKPLYQQEIPALLETLLPDDFRGPLAIDALIYRELGELKLKPVVEVNARCSMGRIAFELFKLSSRKHPGIYRVHPLREIQALGFQNFADWAASFPKPKLENGRLAEGKIAVNDPHHATEFLATWTQCPAT